MNAWADKHASAEKLSAASRSQHSDVENSLKALNGKLLATNADREDIPQNINNPSDPDTPNLIANNINMLGNMLSSSPSELTEQAKSYALGKLNSTISTETQKWLSQFGTARINFSLDRKGTLNNGSLDFLFPLYDNKADWLFFSQFGYRNKDSRNTLNLGLGGRYFTPDWMYGLNTFFDHDITGQNKRLGLGGEAWADYIKLSANTYWRLSNWRQSPKEQGYEERPANGFDLNGEFFLPAYPNVGGKLSYEQYFGDNVALFNRDTKQKNPGLARFGVNYTPIPLVTVGVDYKHGSGGHSEALFQTNLNYKFGVPISVQLSPDNVASMRTLTGNRYDLVERNNNIVLDYRKKAGLEVALNNINGYSGQEQSVTAKVTSERSIKQVAWRVGDVFKKNGGQLPLHGNPITITLPKYMSNRANSYPIYATAEDDSGKVSEEAEMFVTVDPFVVKDTRIALASGDPENANSQLIYNLAAAITHGQKSNPALPGGTVMHGVKWTVEPADSAIKLDWDKSGTINRQGQLTATLTSTKPFKDVKVYLEMDGMSKVLIGGTVVPESATNAIFKGEPQSSPSGPILGNGQAAYTYKVLVVDKNTGAPIPYQSFAIVNWSIGNDKLAKDVIFKDIQTITDAEGYLTASLVSKVGIEGIKAKVSISSAYNQEQVAIADKPVSFKVVTRDASLLLAADYGTSIFISSNQQGRPYNVYPGMVIQLQKAKEVEGSTEVKPIFDTNDKFEYTISGKDIKLSKRIDISFPPESFTTANGPTEVIAQGTHHETGAQYSYRYTFNPQRYVFAPNLNKELGDLSPNGTCETLDPSYTWGRPAKSLTYEDVYGSSPSSLFNDMGTMWGFGLFPFETHNTSIKLKEADGSFGSYSYGAADTTHALNAIARLICKLSD
ncbi:inverse autotransporter beta domain-containing protein [Xenorhabdus bovienii]|uniref:inverse autotransporter beta domain-containing protein n=1 Tax=Xenorhabdus bovienii TaxID=40576 RepID=UPI001EDCB4E6|nr:inverse autotransporter beta domain-containing protein [Xenorhabdus bovienii]MCG3463236.1 inverse autotransporter beta domain-containing protein [Xenorhabdus bovienii]